MNGQTEAQTRQPAWSSAILCIWYTEEQLDNQVPQHQDGAQSRRGKESVAGWTPSLGALLEFFVSFANTLRCLERVRNELVDMLRLCGEVADEQVLELGDFDEGALGGPATWMLAGRARGRK